MFPGLLTSVALVIVLCIHPLNTVNDLLLFKLCYILWSVYYDYVSYDGSGSYKNRAGITGNLPRVHLQCIFRLLIQNTPKIQYTHGKLNISEDSVFLIRSQPALKGAGLCPPSEEIPGGFTWHRLFLLCWSPY